MILEFLRPERIVIGLSGDFDEAFRELLRRCSFFDRQAELLSALNSGQFRRQLLPGEKIAVPHLRMERLPAPEIVLGVAPRGVRINGHEVRVICLLAVPLEEAAEHLQLLERISALLPTIRDDLLHARTPVEVLKVVAQGEREPGRTTYINISAQQVAFELQTHLQKGLSEEEARHRLTIYGPNVIERARRTPWYLKFFRNFFSFFAALLWLSGLLCFLPGVDMPQLGAAILAVIFINGLFAYWQEQKSDRAVELLRKLITHRSGVLRDGKVVQISASSLVPGDVILLEQGDLVPADARLIEAFEVEVDNSALTGESAPAKLYKSDKPVLKSGKFLWTELPNLIFAGTSLQKGMARAVVFGTGMHSEVGKIARLTQTMGLTDSPLQKELRAAGVTIALLAGSLGASLLLLGWMLAELTFLQAFVFFIGLFVANVPEGLLPTVTLALSMGVTRMARRNALVKNLSSVETLGCTTAICSDKTGTLTQNLMMVERIYVDDRTIEVSGEGYKPEGKFSVDGQELPLEDIFRWSALRRLLECALMCNNAQLERAEGRYRILGDPTEGALLVLAGKAHILATRQRLHVNPFESVRKRMSVVVLLPREKKKTAYIKGAPLETLEVCDRILWQGKVRPLTQRHRQRILAQNDSFAKNGYRILALSYRDDPDLQQQTRYDLENVEKRLIFLGLTAMSDPIRPGVPEAIEVCHRAGIRVIMITGDYPLTAETIAKGVGLGSGAKLRILTGAEISEMDDEALQAVLSQGEPVFARVSPEHKLRIVVMLKNLGEIVAVTGDGVNDAPALKKADIGIAMGGRGHEVAREAAHMILMDDNFATIVGAIEEGRAIYDNIKRFVAYIFNSNPQELYPYILWILVPGMPLAMTVMGVLAVDVGTDLIPAMGLGIEPPEKGVMERPPRRREEKLLSLRFILECYFLEGTILALSCLATYYYLGWTLGYWKPGLPPTAMPASPENLDFSLASSHYLQSLTAYFFPTVTTQIANVLSKRSWRTSLFSTDFLKPEYRVELLDSISGWRPRRYSVTIRLDWEVSQVRQVEGLQALLGLFGNLVLFPFRWLRMTLSSGLIVLDEPILRPVTGWLASFLEKHPLVLNIVSNPLINLGIVLELSLCYLFFYTPLSRIYLFAPVPWHVYLFAFHGTLLLLIFEEANKFYLRRVSGQGPSRGLGTPIESENVESK